MIRFQCPQCSGVLEAFEYDSGEEISCRGCGKLVQIPSPPDDYFRFPCPSCGKRLKAKPEHSGKKTRCTNCGTHLVVPSPKGHAASKTGPGHAPAGEVVPAAPSSTSSPVILVSPGSPSPESAHPADSKACPFCGEQILAVAIKCKHCGESLDPGLETKKRKGISRARSTNLAKGCFAFFVLVAGFVAGFVVLTIGIGIIVWAQSHNPNDLGAALMRGPNHWILKPEAYYTALWLGGAFAIGGVLTIILCFVTRIKS